MNTSTIAWILIVILVLLGGWYFYTTQMMPPAAPAAQAPTGGGAQNPPSEGSAGVGVGVDASLSTAPMSATVTYGASGFSPQQVTIRRGGVVTWVNESGGTMWVASAQHPTHTVYSGTTLQEHCDDPSDTSFDQCQAGDRYSFTFEKTGTWNYHDHLNGGRFGSVVVVE
jgi:plastocyanin